MVPLECIVKSKYISTFSVFIPAHIHVITVSQGLSSQGASEQTPPSVLAALAHGFEQRDAESSKPTHTIRVDFKVGHPFLQFITYSIL